MINVYEAKPTAQLTKNHIKNTIEQSPVGFAGFAERRDFETYLDWIIDDNRDINSFDGEEARSTIRSAIETIRVDDTELHVFVFPSNKQFIKEEMNGVAGRSIYQDTICLALTGDVEQDAIRKVVAHEYAHAVMHRYHDMSASQDSMLAFEGVAEHFKEAMVDSAHSPWVKDMPNHEVRQHYEGLDGDESYQELFHGTGRFERWLGYSLGYHLVKEAVSKRKDWMELFQKPPEELLRLPEAEHIE
jgi:uncharacterized protein YjaZ